MLISMRLPRLPYFFTSSERNPLPSSGQKPPSPPNKRMSAPAEITPKKHIHDLPPEILIQIFEHYINLHGSYVFITTLLRKSGLMYQSPVHTLSQVCSRWRSLTCSTSVLWGRISTRLPAWDERYTRGVSQCMSMHLDRSRDGPLHLNLGSFNPRDLMPFVSVVSRKLSSIPYHHRLHSLDINNISYLPGLDLTKEVVFPELRSLSFAPSTYEHLEMVLFPKLRDVSIKILTDAWPRDADITPNASTLRLPWGKLTSLTFGCESSKDIAGILHECRSLVLLTLHIVRGREESWPEMDYNTSFPVLHRLQHFTLHMSHSIMYRGAQLLSRLNCPSLLSLSLIVGAYPEIKSSWSFLEEVVTGFIIRSQCTLTSLQVSGILVTESSLLAVLRSTHRLTSFSVTGDFMQSVIVGSLLSPMSIPSTPNSEDQLVPKLRDIRISLKDHEVEKQNLDVCGDTLLVLFEVMVRSRLPCLHSAVISVPSLSRTNTNIDSLRDIQRESTVALKVIVDDEVLLGYTDS
uniref:F-box domain-containing protein n=1 Tax=Moniliophthora roreri TaxID=221103 RepID=A0A0W0EZ21_MONRR